MRFDETIVVRYAETEPMPVYGAVLITGAILLFAAIVLGLVVSTTDSRRAERYGAIAGWIVFSASMIFFIVGTWMAVGR